jgi:hypothetical protein
MPHLSRDPESLRILYLAAAPKGDLRLDCEMREVRAAVRAATHRDMVELEIIPAATGPVSGLTSSTSRGMPTRRC